MRNLINNLLNDPLVCILWAIMLLLLPLRWLVAVAIAALFHEMSHYIAVVLCGGRIHGFRAARGSMILDVGMMSWRSELVCAIAGPLGSLILILLIRWMPLIGFCACVQFVYNMIPLFPLDGGRIVRCICNIVFLNNGEIVWMWFEKVLILLVLVASVWIAFWYDLGFFPILITLTTVLRSILGKIPCKEASMRVQ